jgi:hypothetical protein
MESTIRTESAVPKKFNLVDEIVQIKTMHRQIEAARKRNNVTELPTSKQYLTEVRDGDDSLEEISIE